MLVLTGAGILMLIAGGVGIFAGLALAERIHALLPDEITSDAAAIGGAALALGAAFLMAGAAHIATATAVARGRWLVGGIVLCALMAVLVIGWAVAAVVSAAAGSAPAAGMIPAASGLVLLSGAYGWAGAVLMRVRRVSRAPI